MIAGMAEVLADFPEVAVAYLFGSTARGDARPDSDVDVAVVLPRGVHLKDCYWELADLATRLEEVTAPHEVDVVLLDGGKPILAHNVLREGRVIACHDEERRVDFESSAIVRALDWRPMYDRIAKAAVADVKRWLEDRRRSP